MSKIGIDGGLEKICQICEHSCYSPRLMNNDRSLSSKDIYYSEGLRIVRIFKTEL